MTADVIAVPAALLEELQAKTGMDWPLTGAYRLYVGMGLYGPYAVLKSEPAQEQEARR